MTSKQAKRAVRALEEFLAAITAVDVSPAAKPPTGAELLQVGCDGCGRMAGWRCIAFGSQVWCPQRIQAAKAVR